MLTAQINIALQVVATLSENERKLLMPELAKITGWTIKPAEGETHRQPNKENKYNIPPKEVLAEQFLALHRKRNSSASKTCISP